MKIDFLKPEIYPKYIINNQNVTKPLKPVYPQMRDISNVYYVPFKGENISLEKKFESLNDIHCPCCGVKMLNEDKLNEILKRAENIQTKEDFISIFRENIDYVDKRLVHTVNILLDTANNAPDIEISGIIAKAKSGANKNLENVINTQIEYLRKYPNDGISQKDKDIMQKCADMLTEMKNNKILEENLRLSHKEILNGTILQMDNPEKYNIYSKLRSGYINAYDKRLVLSNLNANGRSQEYNLISNVFKRSLPHLNYISLVSENEDISNRILLCGTCSKSKEKSISKIVNAPNEKQLEKYNKYLEDIASKIINNQTDITNLYVMKLNSRMKRLSKGDLYIKNAPSMTDIKRSIFTKRKEGLDKFNLTEKDGIPCACCGKDTITHDKKLEIFEQINKTTTRQELVDILEFNENIIRDKYIPYHKELIRLMKENPEMTDDEIVKGLQNFSSKCVKAKLIVNNNYMKNLLEHKQFNIHDRKLVQEYIKNVNDNFLSRPDGEQFNWYNYMKLLDSTVNQMESKDKKHIFNKLKYNIKSVFSGELSVYPLDTVVEKLNSPLKVVAQNIIKEAVATKDHVVAKMKQGTDEPKNLIVLCKSCNQFKGSVGFYNWLMRDKYTKENLSKYFNVINEKIKNGEIEPEYKDYLKELQMNIYEISHGQFDVEYSHNL